LIDRLINRPTDLPTNQPTNQPKQNQSMAQRINNNNRMMMYMPAAMQVQLLHWSANRPRQLSLDLESLTQSDLPERLPVVKKHHKLLIAVHYTITISYYVLRQ